MNIGILRVELHNLERNAETLERVIYGNLVALETAKEADVERYEGKILRKLEKLDEMQDEIDAAKTALKAAGGHVSASPSLNLYEYRPPKYEATRPVKGSHMVYNTKQTRTRTKPKQSRELNLAVKRRATAQSNLRKLPDTEQNVGRRASLNEQIARINKEIEALRAIEATHANGSQLV